MKNKKMRFWILCLLLLLLLSSCKLQREREKNLKMHQEKMEIYLEDKYGFDFTVEMPEVVGTFLGGFAGGGTLQTVCETTIDGISYQTIVEMDTEKSTPEDGIKYRDYFVRAYYSELATRAVTQKVNSVFDDLYYFHVGVNVEVPDYRVLPSYEELLQMAKNEEVTMFQYLSITMYADLNGDWEALANKMFIMKNMFIEDNFEYNDISFRIYNRAYEDQVPEVVPKEERELTIPFGDLEYSTFNIYSTSIDSINLVKSSDEMYNILLASLAKYKGELLYATVIPEYNEVLFYDCEMKTFINNKTELMEEVLVAGANKLINSEELDINYLLRTFHMEKNGYNERWNEEFKYQKSEQGKSYIVLEIERRTGDVTNFLVGFYTKDKGANEEIMEEFLKKGYEQIGDSHWFYTFSVKDYLMKYELINKPKEFFVSMEDKAFHGLRYLQYMNKEIKLSEDEIQMGKKAITELNDYFQGEWKLDEDEGLQAMKMTNEIIDNNMLTLFYTSEILDQDQIISAGLYFSKNKHWYFREDYYEVLKD